MMMNSAYLNSVIRFGFLNQHQTSNSIVLNQLHRIKVEQTNSLSVFPYAQKILEVLPKYGIVNIKGRGRGGGVLPHPYGDLAVVFKKSILASTTFSYSDSLVAPQQLLPARSLTKDLSPFKCINYCEAQIWGRLDLTDVAYFMIAKGTEPSPELKQLGLPIHIYWDSDRDDQTARFESQELILGSFLKASLPAESLTPETLANAIRLEKDAVSRTVLEGQYIASQTTDTLLAWIATDLKRQSKKVEEGQSVMTPLQRYVGELSAREKSDKVIAVLKGLLKNRDFYIAAQAVIGLSELENDEFKAILKVALKNPSIQEIVAGIAVDYLDDREIKNIFCAISAKWIAQLRSEVCH